MRTLHELVPPFLQNNAAFQAHMAAVAAADPLQHNSPSHDSPQKHSDIASLLVNTLSTTALATKDLNQHQQQPLSRPASASQPHSPESSEPNQNMAPALDGAARVTQQAQMAIRSILASANAQQKPDNPVWNLNNVTVPPPATTGTTTTAAAAATTDVARTNGQPSSSKRRLEDDDDYDDSDEAAKHAKIRRTVQEHVQRENDRVLNMTTVVCLHAAVAQKSYGSEKRFLCPPPMVRIEGPFGGIRDQKLSMCIVSETGEKSLEAVQPLDPSMTASFKFLHVTGTAKAKNFNLQLQIRPPQTDPPFSDAPRPRPWAVFESAPVTIISKPSKKTAKTRNISSCILAGGPVSLFNRINSQTVRTKYMTIDNTHLCASNVAWSAFNVSVVRRPQDQGPIAGPQPVTYGSEIVLSDSATGITTAPLVIRKVDKGKISNEDGGPVSQMQKIALQRVNADGSRNYLSAAGPVPGTPGVSAPPTPGVTVQAGTHHLLFASPRSQREETKDGVRAVIDEVDDYLCWTIVGISKFQYTFFDALGSNTKIPEVPITPFPTLFQPPVYRSGSNTLDLTVSSFFYENTKTGSHSPLEIWVGDIGPLHHRIGNALPTGPLTNIASFYDPHGPPPSAILTAPESVANQPPVIPATPQFVPTGPYHTNVTVEMPPVQEIVKALQKEARRQQRAAEGGDGKADDDEKSESPPVNIAGRSLPLLFIRGADGVGYHSGRTITAENMFHGLDLNNPPTGPGGPDPSWMAAAQAAAADGSHYGWSIRVL